MQAFISVWAPTAPGRVVDTKNQLVHTTAMSVSLGLSVTEANSDSTT